VSIEHSFGQLHIHGAVIATGFENIHASGGVIWSWFVFESSDSSPVESGTILESD
jgi:hypothetical protein